MDHALVIYEALQGVNGARLVVKDQEAMLIVLQHEHANKVSMERFPLGSSMDVVDLVKLLDGLGLIDVAVAVSGKGRAPQGGATVKAAHICPECAFASKSRGGLGVHRKRKHGTVSSDPRSQAAAAARGIPLQPADPVVVLDPEAAPATPVVRPVADVCDICGAPWKGHSRCDQCAALIGPGHTSDRVETVVRGRAFCTVCWKRHVRLSVAS